MKNNLKTKLITYALIIITLNSIVLVSWFKFNITPMMTKINNLENTINEKISDKEYKTIDDLIEDINRLSNKYKIKFIIEDVNNNQLTNSTKEENDIHIITDIININNNLYTIDVYLTRKLNTVGLITNLIILQITIVSIIMAVIFLFTRAKIIKPVDNIIKSIKNYKLGIKPIKRKTVTEFDIIQNEFVNLVDNLEEEKQEQYRIIASISHDIKTPLTSIIGYSNLIEEDKLKKEEIKKYNQKINEKAIHIKSILEGFDDYLSNKNNQVLKLTTISIKDLIKEINNDYKIDLENNEINFTINTKLNNEQITIDISKIKRIFSNIISNSIRYIKKEGKIDINIEENDNYYLFKISDNGPGVDENIIDKIFEPLFTTDNSRKISGLGLSICREFILMHKGTIKAYNSNGLTIEFSIPKNQK